VLKKKAKRAVRLKKKVEKLKEIIKEFEKTVGTSKQGPQKKEKQKGQDARKKPSSYESN
jgi:hypothetical protein